MNYCKIIAEIGSVHDGSLGNACALIDLAADSGADIVKFQTHIAEAESLPTAPSPSYFAEESRMQYFERTSFNRDGYLKLLSKAKNRGIDFLSSPFSLEAVDLLEEIGVSSYKIPSGEVTNLPLLNRIKKTGKEVFLSSGMSDWQELDAAVSILSGNKLTILQCTSEYPCSNKKVGLNVILEMKTRYKIPVGFSDHTLGMAAALGAVAYGATVIEKHITFSKKMYGSDAKHSMEPNEFALFCKEIRSLSEILENPVDKSTCQSYFEMKNIFEKSVVLSRELPQGHCINESDLSYKKPGTGIRAFDYKKVIGKHLKKKLTKDHLLSWNDLE